MITENLSTLQIHKLSQAQYERELAAGNLDPNAIYLTPETTSLESGVDLGTVPIQYDVHKFDYFVVVRYYNSETLTWVFDSVEKDSSTLDVHAYCTYQDVSNNLTYWRELHFYQGNGGYMVNATQRTNTSNTVSEFAYDKIYGFNYASKGTDGKNGISPTITVRELDDGNRLIITDVNGSHSVDIENGKDGRGIKYWERTSGNGSAGTTDTYTVTFTDDTTGTFTVYNGKDGSKGDKGDKPVRGTDYWTSADEVEWEQYIASELAKRGQLKPEFAQSEEWLAENGDTSKMYVLPDGYIYIYMKTAVEGGLLNIIDEIGYLDNTRLSTSSGDTKSESGYVTTNLIDCSNISGDAVITTQGVDFTYASHSYCSLAFWKEDGTLTSAAYLKNITSSNYVCEVDDEGNVTLTLKNANYKRVKMCGYGSGANLFANINGTKAESAYEYAWSNTGYAFVPADYEDRIIELEADCELLKKRVEALEDGVDDGLETVQGETVEEQLEWLRENGDTAKIYLLKDGYIYKYGSTTHTGEITNRINNQNTDGFLDDTRLSTSSMTTSNLSGFVSTPIIDINKYSEGFTIKLTGIEWCSDGTSNTTGYSLQFFAHDETNDWKTYIKNVNHESNYGYVVNCDVDTKEVTITTTSKFKECFKQIRFSGKGTSANAVVEITYNGTYSQSGWYNTGSKSEDTDGVVPGYEDRIVNLETECKSLKEKVKVLEDIVQIDNGVPSYVLTEAEEVADKVLTVRNADSFVMALTSDLHTKGDDTSSVGILHAGQAMDTINSLTQLDLVALLGDYEVYRFSYGDTDTDGEDARKSFKYAKKSFSNVAKSVPFMMLQGNHDELSTDTTEEARQKYYAYIGANNVGTVTDYSNKFRNYGYRDFDNYKIRVIYLNTADVSEGDVTGDCNVSAEQLNWLNNVALNLDKTDWGIIVLSHHSLNWSGMTTLLNTLDTYKGKGTGAELIAHFHGHLHNFRVETLGTNNIPTITIPNACFNRNNEYGTSSSYSDNIHTLYGDTDENGNQRQFNKTSNSAEDTAFNVVVVDRQNRKIHCFNYGAGIDREISY